MAGKETVEIFKNIYDDAIVKRSTVGHWVKYVRWPKQRNIMAKTGWMLHG
jgi:hypothetical protein